MNNHSYFGIYLPPPLSEEEEKELLENLPSEKSKTILVERNLRLVKHIVKKFANTACSQNDLFSLGTIGLIKAVNSFDSKKKVKLSTYAGKCIKNEILMYLRKEQNWKNIDSLEAPLCIDINGNELYLENVIADKRDSLFLEIPEHRELISYLITFVLNKLSQKETFIFFYYLAGKSQKEIAEVLGLSQSYISRIEKEIFSKLKNLKNKRIEKKEINFYFDNESCYLEFLKENFENIPEVATHFGINYEDIGFFIRVTIPLHDFLLIADFLNYLYNY